MCSWTEMASQTTVSCYHWIKSHSHLIGHRPKHGQYSLQKFYPTAAPSKLAGIIFLIWLIYLTSYLLISFRIESITNIVDSCIVLRKKKWYNILSNFIESHSTIWWLIYASFRRWNKRPNSNDGYVANYECSNVYVSAARAIFKMRKMSAIHVLCANHSIKSDSIAGFYEQFLKNWCAINKVRAAGKLIFPDTIRSDNDKWQPTWCQSRETCQTVIGQRLFKGISHLFFLPSCHIIVHHFDTKMMKGSEK